MEANENMNEKAENEEKEQKETHPFYYLARRMILAGIGAIALKHDEVEEFVDKLVERGEIAKRDGEDLVKEMRERRKKYFEDDEKLFHNRIEKISERLHVPAKKDIDVLNEKISNLEKKIDELMKAKG